MEDRVLENEIFEAASKGNLAVLKEKLKGCDCNIRDSFGFSPLHLSAQYGQTSTLEYLLKNGARVNYQNHEGKTALHLSTAKGYLHCVKLLLDYDANVWIQDIYEMFARDYVDLSKGAGCDRLLAKKMQEKPAETTEKFRRNDQEKKYKTPKSYPRYNLDLTRKMAIIDQSIETKFSVLSYNVLAQAYTKAGFFPWTPSEYLEWSFRSVNLGNEIAGYNTDIVCLQEVDKYDFFEQFLSKHGYSGIYKKRTGNRKDGCAIFYKSSKFKLVSQHDVEYNSTTESLWYDNVAIFAVLSNLEAPNQIVIAGTTHFYYKSAPARMHQVENFVKVANEIKQNLMLDDTQVDLILTGDFNEKPSGPIHKLLEESGYKNSFFGISGATALTGNSSMIDFIYYSGPKIYSYLTLPEDGLLPNSNLSSDHIPIVVVFG